MKHLRQSLIISSLVATAAIAHAAMPPKYLEVKDFKKCLAEKHSDTYSAWCMPEKKVKACPSVSWKQLRALKGQDALPSCSTKEPTKP